MATAIDICNIALAHLGLQPINSFTENSESARVCNLFYDESRKSLLEMYDWGFARRIVGLSVLDYRVPELNGYFYAYPQNCIRIIKVFPAIDSKILENEFDFEVMQVPSGNKAIFCKFENAKAEYIHDVSDTNLFSPNFTTALSYYLATKLAMPLTGKPQLLQSMQNIFVAFLREAMAGSGRESAIKIAQSNFSKYLNSR